MHAVLAPIGTDGDILPFIGLGATLRARGHRVTLAAAGDYSDMAVEHGLEFRELVSAEKMRELLSNPVFWHPLKTAPFSAKWGASLIEGQFEILRQLADGDTVLISNPAVFAASLAAEKFRRPLVHLVLQPWMIPSAIAPAAIPIVGLPRWSPRFFHRILFRLIDVVGDTHIGPQLNRARLSLDLPPARRILSNWFSGALILAMFPDWFGPPQSDWPAQIKLTSFPCFDGASRRAIPANVLEFLARNRPTILFTFGSGMMHGRALLSVAPKICADLQAQGLIINRHLTPENLPPHMMHTSFLPFRQIFPRCAAIVHHGGIGTTAEALAAGLPQLIVPLGFDQLDNGIRVARLRAGLHTRSKHNLVPNENRASNRDLHEISSAIKRLLSGEFRQSCSDLAIRLRDRNALDVAANHVENLAMCDSPRMR